MARYPSVLSDTDSPQKVPGETDVDKRRFGARFGSRGGGRACATIWPMARIGSEASVGIPFVDGEMILHGCAVSGLGRAAHFTELGWVQRQLGVKLGLHPHPGTFNVRVANTEDQALWDLLKAQLTIRIEEPDASMCGALCSLVLINERIRGAIVVPDIPGYPPDQVEVVAAESIRATLRISDGDPITLRVVPPTGDAADARP